MKKITLLLILLPVFWANAQYVTVTTTYVEPSYVESKYFLPVIIHTKNDSIIKGYGSLSFDDKSIRFVKEKTSYIITNKEWKYYPAKNIKKVELKILDKIFRLDPVQRKGDLGASFLFCSILQTKRIKLYTLLSNIPKMKDGGSFYALKPGEIRATGIAIDFRDSTKVMPSRVKKLFNNCPKLQKKIKNKEYQKTFEDFTKILEYYDEQCF